MKLRCEGANTKREVLEIIIKKLYEFQDAYGEDDSSYNRGKYDGLWELVLELEIEEEV